MVNLAAFTVQEVLRTGAVKFADNYCVRTLGKSWINYAEFAERCASLSSYLSSLGIGPGDRVLLMGENRPEWAISWFAITSMGAVAVPVLVDFTVEQIKNILEHSGAKLSIVSNRTKEKLTGAKLLNLDELSILDSDGRPGAFPSKAFSYPEVKENSLAEIIYTSGTTGFSKGVCLSHKNIVFNVIQTRAIIRIFPRDRFLSILPLAHSYEGTIGMLTPIVQGASINYLDKPPVVSVLLPALKAVKPTFMLSVPLVIEKVCRAKVFPTLNAMKAYSNPILKPILERIAGRKLYATFGGHLRFFGVGGAGLAPDVERFLKAGRFPYAIGYGLTETAPLIAGAGPDVTKLGSTGKPLNHLSLKLLDRNPETGEGEILVKGPNVMLGYYKDEERTREAIDSDGYFHTGDLGALDKKGRLFVKGRLKNMILGPSGENIYPEEIEAMINQSELVLDSLVYEDEPGTLVALVHLNMESPGFALDGLKDSIEEAEAAVQRLLESLKKEVNGRLNVFSKITRIEGRQEPFEKTPTQKIKRFLYTRKPKSSGAVN